MDSTSDSLQFSKDDIRQQLDMLGYHNIPNSQLHLFAQDLERLIRNDSDKDRFSDFSVASQSDCSTDDVRDPSRYHRGPSAAIRRPVSAPSTSTMQAKPSSRKKKQVRQSASREATSFPARHPQPFSYKYGDTSTEGLDTTDDSSPVGGGQGRRRSAEKRPVMKRKVVRKLNGQVQVFDESITDSESGDLHDVNQRLSHLALRQDAPGTEEAVDDDDDGDSTLTGTNDDASSLMDLIYDRQRPHSSKELYSHRPAGDENTVYKPHLPRSFIRPDSAQPKTKHDRKTDPVSRHQMYRAEWNSHRAPGEKNRNDLRWHIREQMMYKDTMVYPRRTPRVYSANNYVVPTDKKRQALRWAVRTSLAHKQMPASTFY